MTKENEVHGSTYISNLMEQDKGVQKSNSVLFFDPI